jgi:hypothetical protein
MIISLSVILISYISNKAITYMFFVRTTKDAEKARALAFGGIQIAISQLVSVGLKEQEKDKEGAQQEEEIWQKKFLKLLLLNLNRWQEFVLKQTTDDIEGTIKICLMCEDGKININSLYDEKEKKFIPAKKELLQKLGLENIEQAGITHNLISSFENFFKERQYKVQDVTELLKNKEIDFFKERIFFEPIAAGQKEEEKKTYLTDIFTVWNQKQTIEPWLLSYSLNVLLGFKQLSGSDEEKKKMVEQVVEKFKVMSQWSEDWNTILAPLYGKEWSAIAEPVQQSFSRTFDPKVFSILSYATVNGVTQRLLAIIERVSTSQDDRYQFHAKIRKVYWL